MSLVHRVGYFYPIMGINMDKNGRNIFLPGRNGTNMVEIG